MSRQGGRGEKLTRREAFIATYGFARMSSSSHSLAIQQEALRASGCNVTRAETHAGTKLEGWTDLETIIQFARAEVALTVTWIGRLARSTRDPAANGEAV